ncbi:uncharacterized protein HRG_02413 [Hirsutella rhossiliensis]|uniref:Uncharacterized protein n=1 Tax=Hirsutella rhossiliensis TaxID=111463 RepID=A0A9P8N750_9HYPO|nr:uncharacterized protein HRG_02413 [Hirsutella rhossiliensis]KAH0967004.1 hypothetical protein HRG_02413 [Hirsutella rhossiliensis]
MPRPRYSESFSVRWHSLANPATPSADIMSSPDPLNDATEQLLPPPSSRRVTRSSLRSQRFASVTSSPRKQMFELQVGDNRSPQKLWVTVETDAAAAAAAIRPSRGTSRKLFQSPASTPAAARRRHQRAVTTTVPLQASIEEDEPGPADDTAATPKRRGRPRKVNGTPMPSAAKRKAAAPADTRSPRRPRLAKTSREPDEAQSQSSVQPTPRSARRGRPPKNKKAPEPSFETGAEATPKASPTKRQRRTRQATVPEELEELAEPEARDQPQSASQSATASEDGMDLVGAPGKLPSASPPADPAPVDDDHDADIWMATISNEDTPRATALPTQAPSSPSPSRGAPEEAPQPDADDMLDSDGGASAAGDYVDFAPAASDISSLDEPVNATSPRRPDDTIAQGEDFSMIFMDSIPSLQGAFKSSIPPAAHEELGEETSLIINNTLESLRQEGGAEDVEAESCASAQPTPAQAVSHPDQDELASNEPTPTRATAARSQSRGPSPRWSRTPRKAADSSPLRHRVLRLKARQAEESAAVGADKMSEEDLLATSQRIESGRSNGETSYAYEDSFSEIPQEILISATPGQPNTVIPYGGDGDEHEEEERREVEDKEVEEEERPDLLQDDDQLRQEDGGPVQGENEAALDEPAPTLGSSASSARSEAGRLPTPDDTPPQPEFQDAEEQAKSDQASGTSSKPAPPSEAPAEPEVIDARVPEPSDAAEQPEQSQSPEAAEPSTQSVEATPVHQISSPLQEPQSVQQEAWHDKTARPALSAIVRAGRALQSITSDPPSPEGREKQLGSPFRSSGSRDSWNGSLNSQTSRRMSKSPQQLLTFAEARAPSGSPAREDPFGAASHSTTGQTHFMQALGVRVPAEQALSPVRGSPGSSMRFTPNSDGAMSWIAREGPISPGLRGDNSLQEAARRSSSAGAVPSLGRLGGAAPAPATDGGSGGGSTEERDDETDIWELEAQRETPRVTRQQPFGKRVAPQEGKRSSRSSSLA